MPKIISIENWYWVVADAANPDTVFSSASGDFVPTADATYVEWLKDNSPTKIESAKELGVALAVATSVMIPPSDPMVLDGFKDQQAKDVVLSPVFKVLLDQENRIRVLEGQKVLSADDAAAAFKEAM